MPRRWKRRKSWVDQLDGCLSKLVVISFIVLGIFMASILGYALWELIDWEIASQATETYR